MIETLAGLPVEVDVASEFRYRAPVVDWTTLCIAISQSGETADTLGAVSTARARGASVLAICNVPGSTLSREADDVILTRGGPEIGVASTKAFTTQLTVLLLLAIHLGRIRGRVSRRSARQLLRELAEAPRLMDKVLAADGPVRELAEHFQGCANALYLGRGINYPLALEGALKLKEVSYVHAEGYPAGEMKHGPIALIDATMPVVVLAPPGRVYDKTLGTIEEIKARNGVVIALASDGDETIVTMADHVIALPRTSEILTPLVTAIPLQLFAYHVAVLRKCDVDQPRNLAKSVTVE
jgi:glucosamine--fructose-6-phosphate aminotransferase (isomerizing)